MLAVGFRVGCTQPRSRSLHQSGLDTVEVPLSVLMARGTPLPSRSALQIPAFKQEESHSIFFHSVFSKTKESIVHTNKPIAISSPK